ncbi:alpha-ribazole phosphatase [Entomomonas asaccharolytica]|uniref:Alpha-ribazole phosphatase n=1 Tax=Entomomonas asaccharolytica TaxID=2785331 RepID=A0A974NH59_9GAMM|nr:alpha-ribazole phosphatase [Entomomonas asaccharolytica]QQP86472.1 alpha-ribazole phosphatase [Entomomonas asaccharolytica]
MKLYFIRHTAVDVAQGVCYGWSDVGLKESFKDEANTVFEQIEAIKFDQVYTSPLSRCTKLANYCGYANAIVDGRLKELNFGDWEMQKWDDIQDPNLQNFYNDWLNIAATNGESFADLYKRFVEFINTLPTNIEKAAIFTHGGIINCGRVYAGVTTVANMFNHTPSYGSVTVLDIFPNLDLNKG